MVKVLISKNDILSALTYWAIRQSPYDFPLNLQEALAELASRIDEKELFSTRKKMSASYKMMEDNELGALIKDLIFKTPKVALWNVTKVEQDMGITDPEDPNRKVKYGITGIGIINPEDKDFIDLDALHRNVWNMLTDHHNVTEKVDGK